MELAELANTAIKGLEQGQDEIRPGLVGQLRWIRRLAPDLVVGKAGAEQMGVEG